MTSVHGLDGDPQAWTVDQVIQQICHNQHPPWSNGLLPSFIPERQALEDIFRQNHVDGDTLLSLDLTVLKEDLAIHSLGQRRAIMKVVEYLRHNSENYQQILTQSAPLINMQSQAVALPTAHSISPAAFTRFTQSPTLHGVGYFPQLDFPATRSPSIASVTGNWGAGIPLKSHTSNLHTAQTQPETQTHQITPSAEYPPVAAPPSAQSNANGNQLDILQASIDAELSQVDHASLSPMPLSTAPGETPITLQPLKKEKRRIAPFSIPQKKEVLTENSYLSPDDRALQDTFYYKLETDWTGTVYHLLEDDSTEFSIQGRPYPTGRRRLVSAQLMHFFRQPLQRLPRSLSLARIPYTQTRSRPSSVSYFTLFPPGTDQPRVYRLDDFPALAEAPAQPLDDSTRNIVPSTADIQDIAVGPALQQPMPSLGDLEYLLKKYPAEDSDEVLPCYGDSGDEWELDDETWQEYQQERAETVLEPTALTKLQVESIIDQTLEAYKREWYDEKLAKIQHKAYRIWLTAAKATDRRNPLAGAHFLRDRAVARLAKLREALTKDVWHNANDVKHQCQSLELTFHSIEEQTYYINALNSNDPPPRPSKSRLQLRPAKKPELLLEGEEVLESESENDIEMSQIDDDDFIDDDNLSDAPSIHHDPDTWTPNIPDAKQGQPISMPDHNKEDAADLQLPSVSTPPLNSEVDQDDPDDESDAVVAPSISRMRRSRQRTSPVTTPIRPQETKNEPQSISRKRTDLSLDSEADFSDPSLLPKLSQASKRFEDQDVSKSFIDLTYSSPASALDESNTDFDVHTPELNSDSPSSPTRKQSEASRSSSFLNLNASDSSSLNGQDIPELKDINGILAFSWDSIEETADHDRALAKAIYSLAAAPRHRLRKFLERLPAEDHQQYTLLLNGLVAFSDDQHLIEDVKPRDTEEARLVVLLYLSYHFAQDRLDTRALSSLDLGGAHSSLNEQTSDFYHLLRNLTQAAVDCSSDVKTEHKPLKRKRKQHFSSEDEDSLDESDLHAADNPDSDVQIVEPSSSHRKRKRAVLEDQEAKIQRKKDRQRIEEQQKRRKRIEKVAMQKVDGDSAKPVNFSEPVVYLDPSIARRIKPHQLKGVQFLWREIIEDPKHQGCILAHTMGLGKTMQVISLLVTIIQCNKSESRAVANHIPPHLRRLQALILCPAALLDNWEDELLMWSPEHDIDHIYKVSSANKSPIEDWSKSGGILLLGYERFLRIIDSDVKSRPSELEHGGFKKLLLDGPNLIIADEAHKMKNPKSKIAQTAKGFRTLSRIALTGSPLNNHLEEYHTMVDWIAPNYLGTPVEFRAKYSEPIEAGLFAESSRADKRLSMRKLHVLKKALSPKIDRADISVIAQDIPVKTEYFITIQLTDLQKKAYNTYVESMLETVSSIHVRHRNTRLWDWIAVLQWLCNHPSCCITKLKQRQQKAIDSARNDDVATESDGPGDNAVSPGEALPDDVIIDPNGPLNTAMEKVVQVFGAVDAAGKLDDTNLSYRTLIVENIVKEAASIGDKTLIFSHSLPTLNFLQKMLERMGYRYCRLDGQTAVSKRQAMTKVFNQKDSFEVFLISMKAGGLGMNLQGANRVIIFDFSFNPSWEEQAVGRAYRLGQKRPVYVYRFRAGGTFEDNMFNKTVFKTQLFNRVVDQKNPLSHASKNIRDWLFPVKDIELEEFAEHLGKDENVLDQIIKRVDCIRNIQLTETFQREDEDTLNEAETREAEEEYNMDHLFRSDPEAYYKKLRSDRGPPASTQYQNFHSRNVMGVHSDRAGPSSKPNSIWPTATLVNRDLMGPSPQEHFYHQFNQSTQQHVPDHPLYPLDTYNYRFHATGPTQVLDETASRQPQPQVEPRHRSQSAGAK